MGLVAGTVSEVIPTAGTTLDGGFVHSTVKLTYILTIDVKVDGSSMLLTDFVVCSALTLSIRCQSQGRI